MFTDILLSQLGLDHLDSMCQLIEELSSLKMENLDLQRKVIDLECNNDVLMEARKLGAQTAKVADAAAGECFDNHKLICLKV